MNEARLMAAKELMEFRTYHYLPEIGCWTYSKGFRDYSDAFPTFEEMLDSYIKWKLNGNNPLPK